jgi:hypothetical protein
MRKERGEKREEGGERRKDGGVRRDMFKERGERYRRRKEREAPRPSISFDDVKPIVKHKCYDWSIWRTY